MSLSTSTRHICTKYTSKHRRPAWAPSIKRTLTIPLTTCFVAYRMKLFLSVVYLFFCHTMRQVICQTITILSDDTPRRASFNVTLFTYFFSLGQAPGRSCGGFRGPVQEILLFIFSILQFYISAFLRWLVCV
ncbi:hypothetical protein BDR04DRAFT_485312 [Suillus decipiens]|nr:hypothetical protein BDR04DRAFT_485312 [Suillus decipiens]